MSIFDLCNPLFKSVSGVPADQFLVAFVASQSGHGMYDLQHPHVIYNRDLSGQQLAAAAMSRHRFFSLPNLPIPVASIL
jgi:hypothetical protein